ncbi:hypothetical protein [Undibacterium umbellatum]|uniref:Uncharacterized protein n=1 Tax=Undibacterium umbellatum TaxID=2762300 RepID=A0ABR6ZFV2_9BURK|nr:hypothetical protein [Undibacterium umbellatum]MBC3910558.1 hypothetical protein [Undibacterium umbellatum]
MFLPWEKLPAWLLGPLMTCLGAYLVLHAEPYSWRQWEALGFIAIGIVIFIFGMKKLYVKTDGYHINGALTSSRKKTKEEREKLSAPNFANYDAMQLKRILSRIDADRYPERVKEIQARLDALEQN